MHIHPDILNAGSSLYRVSAKALIIHDDTILLVRDWDDDWWSFPGGGIDHGETPTEALTRELTEELGVTQDQVSVASNILYAGTGAIVEQVPRVNLFFSAIVDPKKIVPTEEIVESRWFTYKEFVQLKIVPMAANMADISDVVHKSLANHD